MVIVSSGILMLTSNGEIFLDIYNHYILDSLFLIIFIVVGYFIGKHPNRVSSIFLLFLFYYLLFACFNDGHGAGWSHTENIIDKFLVMLTKVFILSITIFVPFIFLLLAFLQNQVIKFLCKKNSCINDSVQEL